MNQSVVSHRLSASVEPVRLGFLGVGWIGRHRMAAILNSKMGYAVAVADQSPDMLKEAAKLAPDAKLVTDMDGLLAEDLDGVVIATPSAQHAEQSIRALDAGLAVFCQKPLGRHEREVGAVVEAARRADRLLGVDFSYRHTEGMRRIHQIVRSGDLGSIFAADLTFHNAYGPDKPWFYSKALSGGGCLVDLGVHLIDLALWILDFPDVTSVSSHLLAGGQPLSPSSDQVEDYAVATIALQGGAVLRVACSWRLPAGCDAVIEAGFFGTKGGAQLQNVNGSFYDFTAARLHGTHRELLVVPPDEWGGRAAVAWADQLARGSGYDPECKKVVRVAKVIDQVYQSACH